MHDQQIVHRDVKPANLIDAADKDGVVLVDFGVARQLGEEEEVDQGTVGIGTPRFMAPEVFAGGTVSPRSDVFGLAATLWTLLTGKPPVYGDPTPLTDVCPGVARGARADDPRRPRAAARAAHRLVRRVRPGARRPAEPAARASRSRSPRRPAGRRRANLIEAIVKTAAGVFEAAACSIALVDPVTGELVYQAAWGAGAKEIVGVRLPPGQGPRRLRRRDRRGPGGPRLPQRSALPGADRRGHGLRAVHDARHAAEAGRQPDRRALGARSPRRRPYSSTTSSAATLFAELAVTALDVQPDYFTSLGQAELP